MSAHHNCGDSCRRSFRGVVTAQTRRSAYRQSQSAYCHVCSAERVETRVTEVLEEALQEIEAIKDLESTSRAGVSIIAVELKDKISSKQNEQVFAEVRDKLSDAAEDLSDRLRNVDGTELVRLYGNPDEEITATVEPAQLAELGMNAADIANLIIGADAKTSAGVVRGTQSNVLLEVAGELDSLKRIAEIPLLDSDSQAGTDWRCRHRQTRLA